jgi:FMN phosphatase YigB (HAD superfamily)
LKQNRVRKWLNYDIIQRSGYFDPGYYQSHYPDFSITDPNPLSHFINIGWKENFNPSEKFDTGFYLKMNPDVKQMGENPLAHYLRHGRSEGRLPLPGQKISTGASQYRKTSGMDSIIHALVNTGKKMVRWIPARYRHRVVSWIRGNLGFAFDRQIQSIRLSNSLKGDLLDASSQHALIDINLVEPASEAGGSIAIHIHIFYPELVKELAGYLGNMPFSYDLYLSITNNVDIETIQAVFSNLPFCTTVKIEHVENRGRDIAPMFCTFGKELARYDYIAHLHGKKSTYNQGATEGWREYLCNSLMGSPEQIKRIFLLMQGKPPFGVVYPQNYALLPYWANTWLANKRLGQAWCTRLGISDIPRGYFNYPASSMFWARGDALAPLFKSGIRVDEFPEEEGQTDGTLAHCLERLFVLCSLKQGMHPAILEDQVIPSWSAWRIDQYTKRAEQDFINLVNSPHTKLIAFDIFDTLLCRPLLDPETIKNIVARQITGDAGEPFIQYRALAEQAAREKKGADVGMDEIYTQLGQLSGLSKSQLTILRKVEEDVEAASLEPRQEVVDLYHQALNSGKPVVLISDMFLPQRMIENVLRKWGIDDWDGLFLSNAIGLRKDTGKLYQHVLTQYKLKPDEFLMVGDSERSDVQIPCDMGTPFYHTFRPVEFARSLPRFSDLIAHHEHRGDIDAEMTFGPVVRKNFSPLHLVGIDPESLVNATPYHWGFSLVGPLLVSFANWLLQKAGEDGIDRFYFLSREGKIIKQVYDQWTAGEKNAPKSEYLVISRRTAGVAAITSLKDILEIAKTTFYPNTLGGFLLTRYGLSVSDERWKVISETLGFNNDTEIAVFHHKIDHLIPLLQSLELEIVSRAQIERSALLQYVSDKRLTIDDRQAVVDIGYGGSVQKYLNMLLRNKVHGYYMMTEERSREVARKHEVLIRASFFENIDTTTALPILYERSFAIEKLLSSDDPQVEYYEMDSTGKVEGHFRPLTDEEIVCNEIRQSIRQGASDYAMDSLKIRKTMLPDFQPSCWTAQSLMESFLAHRSQQEEQLLSKIVLDDHYCGRGLVS